MTAAIWIANIFGWPLIHLTIARIALVLPLDYFVNDNALFVERSWEDGGRTYRRRFAIRKWKSRLPDGASWLGGFAKRRMTRRDRPYLEEFMLETRRAEFAHWCTLGAHRSSSSGIRHGPVVSWSRMRWQLMFRALSLSAITAWCSHDASGNHLPRNRLVPICQLRFAKNASSVQRRTFLRPRLRRRVI